MLSLLTVSNGKPITTDLPGTPTAALMLLSEYRMSDSPDDTGVHCIRMFDPVNER